MESNKVENKEKQIEEMAKEIHKALLGCKNNSCCNCEFNNDSPMSFCKAEYIAKVISKKYQPKLPEDSVVLSREEYEKLKLKLAIEKKIAEESYTQKEIEEIVASKQRIKGKNTANMAFNIIKNIIDKKYAIETPSTRVTLSNIINQIEKEFIKQFGIEVKKGK